MTESLTAEDLKRARQCLSCPVCRRTRRKGRGLCYWIVSKVEAGICPACAAFKKVFGREAHESIDPDEARARLDELAQSIRASGTDDA